jgi:hypothetical protein
MRGWIVLIGRWEAVKIVDGEWLLWLRTGIK